MGKVYNAIVKGNNDDDDSRAKKKKKKCKDSKDNNSNNIRVSRSGRRSLAPVLVMYRKGLRAPHDFTITIRSSGSVYLNLPIHRDAPKDKVKASIGEPLSFAVCDFNLGGVYILLSFGVVVVVGTEHLDAVSAIQRRVGHVQSARDALKAALEDFPDAGKHNRRPDQDVKLAIRVPEDPDYFVGPEDYVERRGRRAVQQTIDNLTRKIATLHRQRKDLNSAVFRTDAAVFKHVDIVFYSELDEGNLWRRVGSAKTCRNRRRTCNLIELKRQFTALRQSSRFQRTRYYRCSEFLTTQHCLNPSCNGFDPGKSDSFPLAHACVGKDKACPGDEQFHMQRDTIAAFKEKRRRCS
ncbi:hypothetical protein GUF51_10310 [Xanthomonas citri pv. citri]|nr:hypothetical protein [Xanthomonas citri pv. citri]